ncbi:RimK family alpha-L-glutamate ligase [Thermodesulfobacteriota bacterium]
METAYERADGSIEANVMSIGILYESDEWSNIQLRDMIRKKGVACHLFFMENIDNPGKFPCKLYVNRVFPSSRMRHHHYSIRNTLSFLAEIDTLKMTVINSLEAFRFDCSKDRYYNILAQNGIRIPHWLTIESNDVSNHDQNRTQFPAIIKPDCGGRSYQAEFVRSYQEIEECLSKQKASKWIIQDFIEPMSGFTTRVEIVGGTIIAVLKRYVGHQEISSYSRNSRYEEYPSCSEHLLEASLRILEILNIEMGGIDFIEGKDGHYYLIDVNSTSNFSEDLIPLYGFDPIEKMADYIVSKYRNVTSI